MNFVPNTEAIMVALEALLATTAGVQTVTRVWQPWDQVSQLAQPAIVLVEPTEEETQRRGQQSQLKMEVLLVCYVTVDPASVATPPNTAINNLVSAIRTILLPKGPDLTVNAQTLGGLVSNVFIDGKIVKDAGIIDNQGSVLIPVTVQITK